jgi:hypothetical protein
MKWPCRTLAAAWIVVGLASPSFAGQVRLVMHDGLVTIEARDATLREILAEWSRVGQTRIVNAESVPGGPMTIDLTDVPERQALDTLLRSAPGFLAVPRDVPKALASIYDRIVLMPGTRPAVGSTSVSPAPFGQSASSLSRDRTMSQPAVVVDDDEEQVPNLQMRTLGAPAGAAQPGMPTAPVPFIGAGMGRQGQPATQGNPSGTPYVVPYNPNQPTDPNGPATGTSPRPGQAVPQAAPRPGMPTPPAGPIKGPEPVS